MYWQDYDLLYKSYDLSFGAVRESSDMVFPTTSNLVEMELYNVDTVIPSMMDTVVFQLASSDALFSLLSGMVTINLYSTSILNPNLADLIEVGLSFDAVLNTVASESAYIESNLYSSNDLFPKVVGPPYISWDDYDVTFANYDLSFVDSEQKVPPKITLFGEDLEHPNAIVDNRYIKLCFLNTINPTLLRDRFIESDTSASDILNATVLIDRIINSNTYSGDDLFPIIPDLLLTIYPYSDNTLTPSLDNLLLIEFSSSDTIYIGIIADVIYAKPLQPTYFKFLSDTGWSKKTIYMKEFDGSWSSKPIYMKQVDNQTWM